MQALRKSKPLQVGLKTSWKFMEMSFGTLKRLCWFTSSSIKCRISFCFVGVHPGTLDCWTYGLTQLGANPWVCAFKLTREDAFVLKTIRGLLIMHNVGAVLTFASRVQLLATIFILAEKYTMWSLGVQKVLILILDSFGLRTRIKHLY